MSIEVFQEECKRTLAPSYDLAGFGLGISGEAGEVAEAIKKMKYHGATEFGKSGADFLTHIEEELGDVLWYAANLCNYLGLSLDTVARKNIEKLAARYPEGFTDGGGIR